VTDDQILVNASPLPDQLWAGVRQVFPPLVAFAVGRGLIPDDAAALLAVAFGVIWPIIAGQLKTRKRAVELASVAGDYRVPDAVASLKS
jgi:hypothetical protein